MSDEFLLYRMGDRVTRGELSYEVLQAYYVEGEQGGVGHVCVQIRYSNLTSNLKIPTWELKLPLLHDGDRSRTIDEPLFSALANPWDSDPYLQPGASETLVMPYRCAPGRYMLGVVPLALRGGRRFERKMFLFDLGDVRPTDD